MPANEEDGVLYAQPTTLAERVGVASDCCKRLKLTMPCVVDTPDNQVDELYAAWPERIYVVDGGGKIAYAGQKGPWGYKPADAEKWLRRNVGRGG